MDRPTHNRDLSLVPTSASTLPAGSDDPAETAAGEHGDVSDAPVQPTCSSASVSASKNQVFLWKSIGGWWRALKIRGRWYWLGSEPQDLGQWLSRHQGIEIIRRGEPPIFSRVPRTLKSFSEALPQLPERWR